MRERERERVARMGNDAMEVDKKKEEASSGGGEKKEEDVKDVEEVKLKVIDLLCQNVYLLEQAVLTKETSSCMARLLSQTAATRKKMTEKDVLNLIETKLPKKSQLEETLKPFLLASSNASNSSMETDEANNKENGSLTNGTEKTDGAAAADAADDADDADADGGEEKPKVVVKKIETPAYKKTADPSTVPECEMYVFLLTIMKLLDSGLFEKARELTSMAVEKLVTFNRRTMDGIAARIYTYYSWSHEKCGDASLKSIRSKLLMLQRTAILRHDEVGQETLLNLLLHNYLHFSLYDHAEKLRSKTQLESLTHRNMHQLCRYLYYVGRIRAIQLDYTESKENLQQALRKAPAGAKGFRITLHKWLCMVHLLLGEIPERTHFTTSGMRRALKPYFSLTQAIRKGDLKAFQRVAQQHWDQFLKDKTHNLIVRLQHNVIRTGLRNISKAYSRISLADVSQMLGLNSGVEEVECIVAKAVRDGAIDAKIDHTNQWITTSEASDIYSTFEPQQAFHSRIMFCLNLHNDAVKAMRYRPNEHKESAETEEARKERLQQEQELAKHLQEEDEF